MKAGLAAAAAAVIWASAFPSPVRGEGRPASVVAVLGFHGSRLADEVKRELESSRFEVLSAELGTRRWQEAARAVDGGRLLRGVVVDEADRALTVYTRTPGRDDVEVRLVLSVNPADRMARRHACLSAVELLHALSGNQAEIAPALDGLDPARTTATGGPAASSPAATVAGAPRPGAKSGRPTPETTASGNAGTTTGAASPGILPASATTSVGSAPDVGVGAPETGWQLGAAATFGVETNGGGPSSHVQFLGRIPATRHLAWCARVFWPLLATQSRINGNDVRAWSFAAAFGLQYTFAPRRRLQPYVGLGLGARLGITETTSTTATQTNQIFPVSGTLGIEAGVRYTLAPLIQVFFELGAGRAWLIPPRSADDAGRAAANGEAARASIGILFES